MHHRLTAVLALSLLTAAPASSSSHPLGPSLDVLVDGTPRPRYVALGTTFVEALKGEEYSLRVYNPFPVRVAVALSVDGLNTIDARHTNAWTARKWVIEPYGTITISGWQTSMSQARRFEFTTEALSYGAKLGTTNDLGVITAVFFRERVASIVPLSSARPDASGQDARLRNEAEKSAPSGASAGAALGASPAQRAAEPNDYAATGIGRRADHLVRLVSLDLDPTPAATINIRYEYRRQLVELGVLPSGRPGDDPMTRRQGAKGFEPGFCPDIKRDE